jgi:hypothetical protein
MLLLCRVTRQKKWKGHCFVSSGKQQLEYIGVQKEMQMIYVYFTGVSADYVGITVVWFEAKDEEWHHYSSGD